MVNKNILLTLFIALAILIIIPTISAISVDFVSPTPANASTVNTRNIIINATIDTENPLSTIIYNWNNTNYSIYDDSLVLYYNFDNRSELGENSTHVKDISRFGNNGTISGENNVTFSNGLYDKAIKFNGNIARVLGVNVNGTLNNNKFTISFWINPLTYSSTAYFYSGTEGGGTRFYLRGNSAVDGTLSFGLSDYNPTISNGYTLNEWQNFVITSNGTYVNIYRNGILIANSSYTPSYPTLSLRIGSAVTQTTTTTLNGSIDNFMVFNKSLTQEQSIKLYKNSLNKINNTQYQLIQNDTLLGINNNQFSFFVNDTLNNQIVNNTFARFLGNLNLTNSEIKYITSQDYGANFGYDFLGGTYIDTDADGVRESFSDLTFHRSKYLGSGMRYERRDASLHSIYSNQTVRTDGVNLTTNLTNITNEVIWAYNNNIKYLVVINYMPDWLADNSSGNCNNLNYCIPSNYTIWQNLIADYINRITSNGIYNSTIEIEVWNEPDTYLLNKLSSDHINKSRAYNQIYNSTRYIIKSLYPNMEVFGTAISNNVNVNNNITIHYLSNFSNLMDGISLHKYIDTPTSSLNSALNITRYYCNLYSANCSRIIISEINILSSLTKNNTNSANYTMLLGESYATLLNSNENITIIFYEWSYPFSYSDSTHYNEYPQRWTMLSEPDIDNIILPGFNIISNFSRYGIGNVYSFNSSYIPIKLVYSKIGSTDNIILINTENDYQNTTLNCGSFTGNLIDTASADIYSCASGSVNLGVTEPYGVRYLTEPVITRDTITQEYVYSNYLGEEIMRLSYEEVGSSLTSTILRILIGFVALFILGISLAGLFYYRIMDVSDLTVFDIVKLGIAILVAVILGGVLISHIYANLP